METTARENLFRLAAEAGAAGYELAKAAFVAGWWVNAACPDTAEERVYFHGCAEVDWQEYVSSLRAPEPRPC